MRLLDVNYGETVQVIRLRGGHRMGEKLRQLALFPGTKVKVMRYAPLGGPIMIEVEGRSVAIGRGIAAHIIVEHI